MSSFGFLLIVVALVFIWLALIRPQKRRQQAQLRMWDSLAAGDEVVTAGGIYGEVTGFAGDDVLVRIAPELEVRVARRAIAGVIDQDAARDDDSVGDAGEPGAEDSEPPAGSYSEESR